MKKWKNRILESITFLAAAIWVLSACCLDSKSNIPLIALFISGLWLLLFAAANRLFEKQP